MLADRETAAHRLYVATVLAGDLAGRFDDLGPSTSLYRAHARGVIAHESYTAVAI